MLDVSVNISPATLKIIICLHREECPDLYSLSTTEYRRCFVINWYWSKIQSQENNSQKQLFTSGWTVAAQVCSCWGEACCAHQTYTGVFVHWSSRSTSDRLSVLTSPFAVSVWPHFPVSLHCAVHATHINTPLTVSPWWKSVVSLWRLVRVSYPVLNYGWASRIKGLMPVTCQWYIPLDKMGQAQ